jgi:hypothetical protein
MIYIDTSYDSLCESTHIEAVYQVDDKDVVNKYKTFMLEKAKDLNLVVNPHWLNEMDYHNNNTHLTKQEYNRKCKEWKKVLRLWSVGKYIIEILNGVKLDYKYLSI